jgi:copper transporter 1
MVVLLEALRRAGKEYDEHIQRDFAARVALLANAGAGPAAAGASSAAGYGSSGTAAACPAGAGNGGTGRAEEGSPLLPQTVTFRASPLQQFVRAVIHAVTFGLAYIIMLLAMCMWNPRSFFPVWTVSGSVWSRLAPEAAVPPPTSSGDDLNT